MSLVVTRWWEQYNLLPWPDNIGIMCEGSQHWILLLTHYFFLIMQIFLVEIEGRHDLILIGTLYFPSISIIENLLFVTILRSVSACSLLSGRTTGPG